MQFEFLPRRRREMLFRWTLAASLQPILIWTALSVLLKEKYFFVFSVLPGEWKTMRVLACVTIGEFLFAVSYFVTYLLLLNVAYTYLISSKFWLKHLW